MDLRGNVMRRVQLKSVAELRQEINAVINPIKARYEYYSSERLDMRKKIIDYFFTPQNEAKILEVMSYVSGYRVEAAVNSSMLLINFESVNEFANTMLGSGLGLA